MMTEEKKNYKDEMDHKSHLERLLQSDESFSVPVPDKGPLHIHIRPLAIFQYDGHDEHNSARHQHHNPYHGDRIKATHRGPPPRQWCVLIKEINNKLTLQCTSTMHNPWNRKADHRCARYQHEEH